MDYSDSKNSAPKAAEKSTATRRDFVTTTASAMAVVGAGAIAWPLLDSLNPSADVLALASTEVDLSAVEVGQTIRVKWRGKPVFIKRRSQEEIKIARDESLDVLPHKETDQERVKKGHDEWLVVVGICTHLGCVPLGQAGDFGGWFCPCHGSHYDLSGRIRRGPAPENLMVPPYEFITDTKIKIG